MAAARTTPRASTTDASDSARPPRWRRYVAVGDSLTEGLCDDSRMPPGQYRGWADRLGLLLALSRTGGEPVRSANLAVRSRRIDDAVQVQLPAAEALGADLVSVLIGANDLVGRRADPLILAERLRDAIARIRGTGCDVLLVTPFLPPRPAARLFERRFAVFNEALRELSAEHGAMLLDVDAQPALTALDRWAEDRVHLNAAGHRGLAYAAANVLGVPHAEALGALESAVHEPDDESRATIIGDLEWWRLHAAPWVVRRARGRTAGDGLGPKRPVLSPVLLPPVRDLGVRDGA